MTTTIGSTPSTLAAPAARAVAAVKQHGAGDAAVGALDGVTVALPTGRLVVKLAQGTSIAAMRPAIATAVVLYGRPGRAGLVAAG